MNRTHRDVVSAGASDSLAISTRLRRRKYLRRASFVLLWLFGLFSVFFSPAPMSITPEMQEKYQIQWTRAQIIEQEALTAYDSYWMAKQHADAAKVWFWRFRAEARSDLTLGHSSLKSVRL